MVAFGRIRELQFEILLIELQTEHSPAKITLL